MFTFRSNTNEVKSDGLDGHLGQWKGDGIMAFPLFQRQLLLFKRDVIKADRTDLYGTKAKRECQMNHGICSDVCGRGELQAGK